MLQQIRLSRLVLIVTLAGVLACLALAVSDRGAAAIALLGAVLIAAKGLGWLLVLRHYRVRLRRSGFRW